MIKENIFHCIPIKNINLDLITYGQMIANSPFSKSWFRKQFYHAVTGTSLSGMPRDYHQIYSERRQVLSENLQLSAR